MKHLLEVKNVTYNYKGHKKNVLNGVNVSFECGTLYSIVGRSGSGKTTMLSLIAGLDLCKNGEILFNGEDLKKIDRDNYRSKRIGVVFQGYNLLTNLKAVDNVVLSMNISGLALKNKKEYAYKLLADVGIDKDTANRTVYHLSGGEQQRVGIARALACDSDLIIADEPTGNLDQNTTADVLAIFEKLVRDEGKCVILVTHSKKVAEFTDVCLLMKDGQLKNIS